MLTAIQDCRRRSRDLLPHLKWRSARAAELPLSTKADCARPQRRQSCLQNFFDGERTIRRLPSQSASTLVTLNVGRDDLPDPIEFGIVVGASRCKRRVRNSRVMPATVLRRTGDSGISHGQDYDRQDRTRGKSHGQPPDRCRNLAWIRTKVAAAALFHRPPPRAAGGVPAK